MRREPRQRKSTNYQSLFKARGDNLVAAVGREVSVTQPGKLPPSAHWYPYGEA